MKSRTAAPKPSANLPWKNWSSTLQLTLLVCHKVSVSLKLRYKCSIKLFKYSYFISDGRRALWLCCTNENVLPGTCTFCVLNFSSPVIKLKYRTVSSSIASERNCLSGRGRKSFPILFQLIVSDNYAFEYIVTFHNNSKLHLPCPWPETMLCRRLRHNSSCWLWLDKITSI